jgi:hypothetical protein
VKWHAEEIGDFAGGGEASSFVEANGSLEWSCCVQRDALASSGVHVVFRYPQELFGNRVSLPIGLHGHPPKMADLIHNRGCYRTDDLSDRCNGGIDGHVSHAVEHAFGIQYGIGEGAGSVLRTKGREGGCEACGYGRCILWMRFADRDRGGLRLAWILHAA